MNSYAEYAARLKRQQFRKKTDIIKAANLKAHIQEGRKRHTWKGAASALIVQHERG